MHISTLAGSVWRDLKYGARQLRRNPAFAATAVVSVALGIAANTATFTLVDQILLRLLPVANPRELVQFRVDGGRVGSQSGDGRHTFSYPAYRALRDRNSVLSGLTGQLPDQVSLIAGDRSEMIGVGLVSGNFFQVLGVRPHLGRVLTAEDNLVKNGHPVAVLQYDFWRTRFGARTDVVGSTIRLNGAGFNVIGVAAPGFEGMNAGLPTRLWAPVLMKSTLTPTWDDYEDERSAWFYLFGRLKPGVTQEQAQASLRVLFRQLQEEELRAAFFSKFPDLKDRFLRQSFLLVPAERGQSSLRSGFERPLIVLQCMVGLVLLIACTNVANLLLARAAARHREVAIRGALGASRGQLARQLFVEGLILAGAGGVVGLSLSSWLTRGLVRFLPFDPANVSLSTVPDARILVFTMAVTMLTAVLFGLVPAIRGSRVSPGATLKDEAGSVVGGHGHVRLRKTFVALQVGLSALLLIGAGLFARTLDNLRSVNVGFRTENIVQFGVRPATLYDEQRKLQVFRTLIESLSTVPGVLSAGANSTRLLMGGRWDSSITIAGLHAAQGADYPWSFFNAVTPGYFETLGIPIKAGRDFRWDDWGSSRKLCLVNEALAGEYLKEVNPLGRTLGQGRASTPDTEIIGVFGNARYDDVRGAYPRQTFVSISSRIRNTASITVYARVAGDPARAMPLLREQVRRVDSNLVVSDMRTLDDQLNFRLANERMLSFLSVGFAVLATLLAVVGLHGVLAFVVTRRTREIGVRMALGAGRGNVIGIVVGEMLPVILLGIGAGVAAGLACGAFVESQLFGVKASDPAVFAVSIGVLASTSLLAALLPAWRASRLDPMVSLRHD